MARVYSGERVLLSRVLGPVERLALTAFGHGERAARTGSSGRAASILFSLAGWLLLYVILRTASIQPWNDYAGVTFHAAPWNVTFNTVSSFLTNTNWQYYGGETTLTYFSQMIGLTVQNFVSAAVGIVVAVALIRGIVQRSGKSLGNFYEDLVRTVLYVLLPISFIAALVLVSQGVLANISHYSDRDRPDRHRADDRAGAGGRRRRRSRSSAPTAAASSTSTRRIRSRTPTASRTSSRCCSC